MSKILKPTWTQEELEDELECYIDDNDSEGEEYREVTFDDIRMEDYYYYTNN